MELSIPSFTVEATPSLLDDGSDSLCEKKKRSSELASMDVDVKRNAGMGVSAKTTAKNTTILNKREGKGIWEGLYEFPVIETNAIINKEELIAHVVDLLGRMPNNKLFLKISNPDFCNFI